MSGVLKVLVVGLNFYPEQVGIGVYTTDMCRFFADQGLDVTVVTGFPFYPERQPRPEYAGRRFCTEVVEGMTVHRCWTPIPRTWTAGARMMQELAFAAAAGARLASLARPDLMVTVTPPLGAAVVALGLCRLRRVPLAVHVQDLQVDAAAGLRMVRSRWLLRALGRAERWVYKGAALVTALDGAMRTAIVDKGIPPERVHVFPNWVDRWPEPDAPGAAAFRTEHGLENLFLVVYSGSMGVKHGLRLVLDIAALADDPTVRFVLIGDGAERKELEREARSRGLQNVTFLPLQPVERMPAVLTATDVAVIPQRPEVRDQVVPSKLLRLLAGGVPILAPSHPDSGLAKVLLASGGGEVGGAGDAPGAWRALVGLKRSAERRREMGQRGRAYAARVFGRDAVLSAYLRGLKALASDGA
jgi:colanic acid biosynthesis glycosyl transferase WcaI